MLKQLQGRNLKGAAGRVETVEGSRLKKGAAGRVETIEGSRLKKGADVLKQLKGRDLKIGYRTIQKDEG